MTERIVHGDYCDADLRRNGCVCADNQPMDERERLAALLHAEWDEKVGEPSEPGIACPDCEGSADRLLAAGVHLTGDERLRACVKCGATDIHVRLDPSLLECGYHGRELRRGRDKEFSGEHLHHFCRGCSWEWGTPPLDALRSALTETER